MAPNWPNAVAHRIGLGGTVDFTPARVGQTLHIPCARGHIVDFTISGRMPPDFVAKKMMQKGWTLGSKLLCPKHAKAKRTEAPEEESPMPANDPPPMLTETVIATPTAAAGKAKRLVYMALEDYYDEAAKTYKPGHSDASIAKSCNLAVNVVKTIREESYGPLAEPNDAAEFRAALQAFRDDINKIAETARSGVLTLERRLDGMAKRNGWAE